MARRAFNSYFLQIGIGTHPKFARLTDAEFRAHVAGVLAIAAMSPVRGSLLVGELPAEPVDIAVIAGVPERVVKSAMVKLQAVGVLERDEDHDCLRVHDWADINPVPRNDSGNAERQARHRARNALRNGGITQPVTADVTACNADEVEVEVEERANALSSGAERAARENEKAGDEDRANCRRFSELVRARHPKAKIPKAGTGEYAAWLSSMRLLRTSDGNTADEIRQAMDWAFADEFWGSTIQAPSGLRSHFSQIWAKMTLPASRNGNGSAPSTAAVIAGLGQHRGRDAA